MTPDLFPAKPRSSADFSPCGLYRYTLHRTWGESAPLVVVGLNPSTADAVQDDPTIRRCVRFARDHGHGGLVMLNLFAFRSTDPAGLLTATDPVGPGNDRHIREEAARAGRVVAAWGAHPSAQHMPGVLYGGDGSRAGHVLRMLRAQGEVYALGLTQGGHPRHPLYVRADTPLIPFGT